MIETDLFPQLRPLRVLCAALLGCVVLYGALSWFLVDTGIVPPLHSLPDAVELSLAALSGILILLSSRVRSSILRRALPRRPELPIDPAAVLVQYRQGTILSFALLEAAGLLGLGVALISGEPSYGIVLCAAAAVAMLTRWPREGEVDRIARGRLVP